MFLFKGVGDKFIFVKSFKLFVCRVNLKVLLIVNLLFHEV